MNKYHLASINGVALLCLLAGSFLPTVGRANANPVEDDTLVSEPEPMEQVTSVEELRDVSPDAWAYEALQSLVERYGCIVGYPDQTYRGNRALSRWEFAAGLNACMNTMERLIQENVAVLKEDVDTLKRLMQEFEAELAALGGRVDNLEGRVSFLEDHQFSTTTKLSGEVIFSVAGATGGEPDSDDPQITFNNRVRLNLTTSFTGEDALITGLQSYNFGSGLGGGSSFGEILFPNDGSILSDSMAKLNYEPQFPGFNPQNLEANCGNNDICLYKLLYLFPVTDNLSLFIAPMVETTDAFPTIIPFASEGQGAISRFAALNPVLRVSGGTSGTGLASAGGFIFTPIPEIDIRALYASVNAAIPENEGFLGGTPLGAGLFNGSFVAATQLTLKPTETLDIGLNYAYSYHQLNILATGTTGVSTGVLGDLPLTTPVNINSVGASVTWRFSDIVHFTSYGAYFFVKEAGGDASTRLLSWMTGFYFPDAFAQGNSAGLIFGQPLYRVDSGGEAALIPENVGDRTNPYHLEAYYNFKLNDNISITPGAFVLFNPEGDGDNDTTGVFVLRTTYTF
ncbi:S-layer protein [Hydrococcus rivularis NIES-593]|uniref:S-layer protein n=1 Tax=Hydrococcus rivularis NIES-593 TaxID=1921803 RepID=A0A1U7HI99_9CYAN|nr:iron uptake porin [Hydrococcus rivularis]OKH23284.1 S-layer protein [Hydrococcus rivularis NIES-593]